MPFSKIAWEKLGEGILVQRYATCSMGRPTTAKPALPAQSANKNRALLPRLFRFPSTLILLGFVCCVFSSVTLTQISPGTLAKPHSFLEGATHCTQCHAISFGSSQFKCLDCKVFRNSHVTEIRDRLVKLDIAGASTEIPNDFVLVMIGGNPPEEFLRKAGIEIVEKSLSIEHQFS